MDTRPLCAERLQENAIRLAKLEAEWSAITPNRRISFEFNFENHVERMNAFTLRAEEAGFKVRSAHVEGRYWEVTASVEIKPTPEKVTELENLLQSFEHFSDDHGDPDRCRFNGWRYPSKRSIQFWPSYHNNESLEGRAAALFGGEPISDPLGSQWKLSEKSFQLVPSTFLRLARARRPNQPQATVSAFSQWVYSLYGRAEGGEEDLQRGKAAEQHIWERRRSAAAGNDNQFLGERGFGWTLSHNGLCLRDQQNVEALSIPELPVGGKPLRASPDLLYVSSDRTSAIIVEIKCSRLAIPSNLWPNVWAQLWCYAQLDIARQARDLTVVGEVWGEWWTGERRFRGGVDPSKAVVCLRAMVRRDPRLPAYDRFFRRLFEVYAGRC